LITSEKESLQNSIFRSICQKVWIDNVKNRIIYTSLYTTKWVEMLTSKHKSYTHFILIAILLISQQSID